jgi:hypothetical protein
MLAAGIVSVASGAWAAGNYAFAPPQDWLRVHSGTTSKWMDPDGTQVVTLFPTEFGGDLSAFVTHTLKSERKAYPTQHVWTNRNYAICGGHTARYVIWTAPNSKSSKVWEQVLALWGYDGYIATYTRPQKSPPSSVARASLLSICGVGTVPQAPGGVMVAPHSGDVPPAQGQPAGLPDAGDQASPNPSETISHPYMPVLPP